MKDKVGAYFMGQLSFHYKLREMTFTSYSLYDMIEFIKLRGGIVMDENFKVLYQYPFNDKFWFANPDEQSPSLYHALTFNIQ